MLGLGKRNDLSLTHLDHSVTAFRLHDMNRHHLSLLTLVVAGFSVLPLPPLFSQDEKPKTLEDRLSYAYGVVVARDLKARGLPINVEQFVKGFAMIAAGKESLLSEEEIAQTFDENQFRMDENTATGADKENLVAGKEFLAKNAKKEGVISTPRGLQYEVLKEGQGPKPTPDDRVTVHYHGTLIDGTVFDSTIKDDKPASFFLGEVIPGWIEGVQLMTEGSKYRFYIPYHLAYGEGSPSPAVKPYSALIFEIELLKVTK